MCESAASQGPSCGPAQTKSSQAALPRRWQAAGDGGDDDDEDEGSDVRMRKRMRMK